jgi:hypothetical protein
MRRIMLLLSLFGFSSLISMETMLTGMETMQIEGQVNPKKRTLEHKTQGPEPKRQATESLKQLQKLESLNAEIMKHLQKLESLPPYEQLSYFSRLLMEAPKFSFWNEQGRLQVIPAAIITKNQEVWGMLLNIFIERMKQVPSDLKQAYAALALRHESSLGQPSLLAFYASLLLYADASVDVGQLKGNLRILVEQATEQQKFNALYVTLFSQLAANDAGIVTDTAVDQAMEAIGYLFQAGVSPTVSNRDGSTIIDYLNIFELSSSQVHTLATFIAMRSIETGMSNTNL